MFERKQKPLTIGKKWKLTVWEANWDMASAPDRIIEQANVLRSEDPDADPDQLSFHQLVYPWLAAYSTGNVPSPEEAFQLSDEDLDKWYAAVRCTNPDLFPDSVPLPVTLALTDTFQLQIQSARLASSVRRLAILDNVAHRYLLSHPEDLHEFARLKVFSKLAGCTVKPPSYEEATKQWPALALQKWYEAVLKLNPYLFLTEEEETQQAEEKSKEDLSKKN